MEWSGVESSRVERSRGAFVCGCTARHHEPVLHSHAGAHHHLCGARRVSVWVSGRRASGGPGRERERESERAQCAFGLGRYDLGLIGPALQYIEDEFNLGSVTKEVVVAATKGGAVPGGKPARGEDV